MKKFLLAILVATLVSNVQAEVKTLVCMTNDMSPNVDIRVEIGNKSALVKLILFGNDVDQAPTEGLEQTITLAEAKALLGGNAIIPFYNEKNDKLLVILRDSSGTISVSSSEGVEVIKIDNCH